MRKLLVILMLLVSLDGIAQVLPQGSATRTYRNLGGISSDSLLKVPLRVPHGWIYNPDSTGMIGFDVSDKKLKLNDGTGVISILSEKDTGLIKYYIDNNPKLSITWDSVKNKPGIIDTIESKFQDYYTKAESDARYLNQDEEVIVETSEVFKYKTDSIYTLENQPLSTCHFFFKLNNIDVAPEDMVIDYVQKKVRVTFPILYTDYAVIYYSYKE